jgi:hypothetical protein
MKRTFRISATIGEVGYYVKRILPAYQFAFFGQLLLAEPAPAKAGVVGVLNVFVIRLRCLLLAAALSFESEWYEQKL